MGALVVLLHVESQHPHRRMHCNTHAQPHGQPHHPCVLPFRLLLALVLQVESQRPHRKAVCKAHAHLQPHHPCPPFWLLFGLACSQVCPMPCLQGYALCSAHLVLWVQTLWPQVHDHPFGLQCGAAPLPLHVRQRLAHLRLDLRAVLVDVGTGHLRVSQGCQHWM